MHKYGEIAERYGFGKMELKVCRSGAGYYIGTWDDREGPISRESVHYYATAEEAQKALEGDAWVQRDHP